VQFGITSKLFVAVLLTNVVTQVAVALGVRAAFDSGFDRYIQEREELRLVRLAEVVATAYRDAGSWDFLRRNDELWTQLNHSVRPVVRDGFMVRQQAGPGLRHSEEGPPDFGPGTRRLDRAPGFEPPRGDDKNVAGLRFGPMRLPPSLVLDARDQVVVGDADPAQKLDRKPIMVAGERVGWIASPVRRNIFDLVDRRFQQRVWQSSAIVALLATALAAIVAWFLARGLLAPVKRIAAATRKLADGDYSTRVASSSRDELGRLVEDFNRLGNALEKNETVRRAFMADVSHELRTPLAVLRGELEAIEDGVREPTPDTIRSLQAEVARLGKLVDDIHDLSLADVGGLANRFEDVDLAGLARATLEGAAGRIEAHHLAVDASGTNGVLGVRGDALRLAQLLGNLLENSLRYTDGGGSLRVALRRQGNKALLEWEDSKPGVPADALPRLFERLYRVEGSRNRDAGGSGLGLAIAKSIVEAHGGTISAAPSPLGGLRIEVQLPLASPSR